MSSTNRPWLTQTDDEYKEKGPYEELGDFEHWLMGQMADEQSDDYGELCPVLQTALYGIFCTLCDSLVKEASDGETT